MSDRDFDSLFTCDKPVIFNFHAYPTLIHKLTYNRANHENFHVHGYRERGNINTPLELAIVNEVDRFHLAIDVIDRVKKLQGTAAHTKDWLKDEIVEAVNYAHEHGIDKKEFTGVDDGRCRGGSADWVRAKYGGLSTPHRDRTAMLRSR